MTLTKLQQTIALQLILSLAYFLFACVALNFATVEGNATLIWPSSGIALAVLVRFGSKYAVGIFLGAYAAGVYVGNIDTVSLMIAIGNTLEPLFAIYLLRFLPFSANIYHLHTYVFLILCGCVGAIVSAFFGTQALLNAGYIIPSDIVSIAFHWWMADAFGVILITPFLLLFNYSQLKQIVKKNKLESVSLLLVSILLALFIFNDSVINELRGIYLLAIPLFWAIFRFGQSIVSFLILVFFIVGIYGLLARQGVFFDGNQSDLESFWRYFSVMSISSMVLAYLVTERNLLYQAINNSQTNTYIFYEDNLCFEFVNKAALKHLGVSRIKSFTLSSIENLVPADSIKAFNVLFEQLQHKENSFISFETTHQRQDGSVYPVEINIQAVEHNSRHCYLTSVTDITERKDKEAAIKVSIEANDANRAKSEFLSNMSHEMRTPMHGILSFSNFGINNLETVSLEKLGKYFSQINESGNRLLYLLNDLLDLSKLEEGKMVFEFGPVDLKEVTDSCIAEQQGRLDDLNIIITVETKAQISVVCDAVRMGQVITNLLSNAIKFSPEHSSIKIVIQSDSLKMDSGAIVDGMKLSVADEGVGIPEGEMESIFNKFVQSTKTKTGAGGTGLGLSICHEIIKGHHGRIWAENVNEGGVIFSFVVPIKTS